MRTINLTAWKSIVKIYLVELQISKKYHTIVNSQTFITLFFVMFFFSEVFKNNSVIFLEMCVVFYVEMNTERKKIHSTSSALNLKYELPKKNTQKSQLKQLTNMFATAEQKKWQNWITFCPTKSVNTKHLGPVLWSCSVRFFFVLLEIQTAANMNNGENCVMMHTRIDGRKCLITFYATHTVEYTYFWNFIGCFFIIQCRNHEGETVSFLVILLEFLQRYSVLIYWMSTYL